MPPVRLRYCTLSQPAAWITSESSCWSGQARMDSAKYTYASGLLDTLRATEGNARMRYSRYTVRNAGMVGLLNSHTTRTPPGLVTLRISASAAGTSATLRRPKEMVTASNVASPNGRCRASPAVKGNCGSRDLPTCNMPREKSQGTTKAPA